MKLVSSVGLLLFDQSGRILLLRELETKLHYGKVAGMLSVPIETIEQGEKVNQTFRRLLVEEVGVLVDGRFIFFKRFQIKLNDAYTEEMSVFTGICKTSFVPHPKDTDVQYFGWMLPRDILNLSPGQVRLEVKPLLGLYLRR